MWLIINLVPKILETLQCTLNNFFWCEFFTYKFIFLCEHTFVWKQYFHKCSILHNKKQGFFYLSFYKSD